MNRGILRERRLKSGRHIGFIRAGRFVTLVLALCLLCGACANAEGFEPVRATVTGTDQFEDIMLDLEQIDLEYGDSVDISFSGGYEFKAVPYYPDFYGKKDSAILTDHFHVICVAGIGCSLNLDAGIKPGETATITLEQKGRYRAEFEAYNIRDARYRVDDQTAEAFSNAREVAVGNIRPGRLHRGSSPFDQNFGRVGLMGSYIVAHDIRAILDLTDTPERLAASEGLPDHTAAMIAQGRVVACPISVDYMEPEAMHRIGEGLARLTELEGPWLIHCNLGRDRTGVICAVLEALCGATYDEIVQDYMFSYDQLHDIDMNPESLQYRLFKLRIDELIAEIFGTEIEALPGIDLRQAASDYLMRCGMTEDQIDRLVRLLTD